MKTYIIEAIKHPIDIVNACNERQALNKYAHNQGYESYSELLNMCEEVCDTLKINIDVVSVQCVSKPHKESTH